MSDNEYEEIKYYNRDEIAREQSSSTSKRNNNLHSPRYDYSLETNLAGEITIRRLNTNVPRSSADEIVRYENERKSNKSTKGQSSTKQQAIEIETINNDDHSGRDDSNESTHNINNMPNNEIQLQCLECMRSQQNSRQQQQQQQYATDYSEPSSPKKKGVCAPVYQHIVFRIVILTMFFVILCYFCFINIYIFIFIFVSIVVVIFGLMGGQDANEIPDQFEE